jgi:hypothetical protein
MRMMQRSGSVLGDQQRPLLVAVIDDLEQVMPPLGGERFGPPVVDDQQPGAFQRRQRVPDFVGAALMLGFLGALLLFVTRTLK